MKGETILYMLESCHLKMGVMLHIISLLVQTFFMEVYVIHIYVGLGCLFHTGKVPGANNCDILNFFQSTFIAIPSAITNLPVHTFILFV